MKLHLTDRNYKKLLRERMVILIDTREQNTDIAQAFDREGVRWKKKALKTGDFNCMVEASEDLGWYPYDIWMTDELVIERKNSVDELAGNFAKSDKDSGRILREFDRMIGVDRAYLLIEDDSLASIIHHDYRSELNEDAYLRSLLTVQAKNQMVPLFINKSDMPKMIWEICKSTIDKHIEK